MIYEFEILTMYDESIEVTTSNETTFIDREQDRLTVQCCYFMADTFCWDYVPEEVWYG